MNSSEIVKDFVQAYYKAQKFLDDDNVDEARKQYYKLLDHYSKLNKAGADEFQKELAYDQVTKVFNRIKESQVSNKIPLNVIVAGILIIIFSVIVALNPGIVGLATFQDEITQQFGQDFDNTTVTTVILKQEPLSFAISGQFAGESAKVFMEKNGKLILVFDSSKANIDENGKFMKSCEDTCKLEDFKGTTVKLFIEVTHGKLRIDDIVYYTERIENLAPEWIGKQKDFNVKDTIEVKLSDLFKDPEGDKIVYLSTTEDGLDVIVEKDLLRIKVREKPEEAKTITIIASDLGKLTKVPITLHFQ